MSSAESLPGSLRSCPPEPVYILGAGMHPWGKWGRDFTEYGVVAARAALRDAGLDWRQIQLVAGAETIRIDGRRITEALLNHIEVAIRAFDPCLSCATHALGQMPLAVELVDAGGITIDRLVKGGEAAPC